jgi:hypothetical protein
MYLFVYMRVCVCVCMCVCVCVCVFRSGFSFLAPFRSVFYYCLYDSSGVACNSTRMYASLYHISVINQGSQSVTNSRDSFRSHLFCSSKRYGILMQKCLLVFVVVKYIACYCWYIYLQTLIIMFLLSSLVIRNCH